MRAGEDLVGFAQERIRVGVGDEQDVALARASLGTQQDQLRQAMLAHEQALRALELLLGRYPAAEIKAAQALARLPGPVPPGCRSRCSSAGPT